MCCHSLYIYLTCGHSTFAPRPLIMCLHASIPPDGSHSTICEIVAHPYRSWRLEQLCPPCQERRQALLDRIDLGQKIEYDEWKWKVSYGVSQEREDCRIAEAEGRSQEEGREMDAVRGRSKRFSWRSKN